MKAVRISYAIIVFLFLFPGNGLGQKSLPNNRFSVGLSISDCPLKKYADNISYFGNSNIVGLFVDYKIVPYFSAGLYGGYNNIEKIRTTAISGSGQSDSSSFGVISSRKPAKHFGFHGKVHFMPIISSGRVSRLDVYAKGKMGRVMFSGNPDGHHPPNSFTDYGVYAGVGFDLFGSFGAFAEFGIGVVSEKSFGIVKRF